MSIYNINNKKQIASYIKTNVIEIAAKVWEPQLITVTNDIQVRLAKTMVKSATLSQIIKKKTSLKSLPTTAIPYADYRDIVQALTDDKEIRGKLYQYRSFAMRTALLKTLLDTEASKKKLSYKVVKVLEAVVAATIENAADEVTIGQIVHKAARDFKVRYICTKEGDKIENPTAWMVDELVLQLINELAEMDMLNMRVAQGTHMVSIPDEFGKKVESSEWLTLASYSAIANRKTILDVKPEIQAQMVSQSSWFYQTPELSDSMREFFGIMSSIRFNFTETACLEVEEKFLKHLKETSMPKYGKQSVARFQEQIAMSHTNGGHHVAGIIDSATRYYFLAEFGHFQTSSAMRSMVEIQGILDPVKWDMKNNVVQLYAVSLRNKLLASYSGLTSEKDGRDDLRLQIARGLNRKFKFRKFTKDNIKPLFMVWAYNAGLLEGVVTKEKDFITGREIITTTVPGLRALSQGKVSDTDLWEAWDGLMNELVPAIVALKVLFKQLLKANPLTETSWMLPDGAIAQYVSAETVSQELHWVDSNGMERTHTHHRKEIIEGAKATGLLPRVIHSIDAYIMRQLVIRMNKLGIIIIPNHDSFIFDRCHEATVTAAVKALLIEVMEGEVLSDIVIQLNKAGKKLVVKDGSGKAITADMFGDPLTKEDILSGSPMATEEM